MNNSKQLEDATLARKTLLSIFEDEKLTRQELQKSEERFRRMTDNAKDMIYRMSLPDCRYEFVSPAAKELFGYSPQEFYEKPVLIQQAIHPEWREYFSQEWLKLIEGKAPPVYEYQIIYKSGEMRWLNQCNVIIRDENGKVIAIEGIVTDITERKQAEKTLRMTRHGHQSG